MPIFALPIISVATKLLSKIGSFLLKLRIPFWVCILAIIPIVFIVGRCDFDYGQSVAVVPDTVYVDREILRRDTVNVIRPRLVEVYKTVTELRVDTVEVPVDFNYVGMISDTPITKSGRDLTLTSFDTRLGAYTQQTFSFPKRKWKAAMHSFVGYGIRPVTEDRIPELSGIGIEAELGYKRLDVVGMFMFDANFDIAVGVKVRYRLFGNL